MATSAHIAFRMDDASLRQLEHVLGIDGVSLSKFARRAICAAIAERLIAFAKETANIGPDLTVNMADARSVALNSPVDLPPITAA